LTVWIKIIGTEKRLIGTIRRECLDHVVVFGEDHLGRTLKAGAAYYNHVRTHLALAKDAPLLRPVQQLGDIAVRSILGGVHHEYCRIKFSAGTTLGDFQNQEGDVRRPGLARPRLHELGGDLRDHHLTLHPKRIWTDYLARSCPKALSQFSRW
jgi:hypothetical protein